MSSALSYLNEAFKSIPDSDRAYKFRKKLVDEVTERANELTSRGLKDENVINDLIISEHPDIKAEFNEALLEYNKKKKVRNYFLINALATVLIILVSVVLFLVDLLVLDNGKSWLLLVAGFTTLCIYYTSVACTHYSHKRHVLFHIATRLMIAFTIMVCSALVFCISLFEFNIIHSWVFFLVGVICVFLSDSIYAHIAKQRFAIFLYMLYIPFAFALLYVIFSVIGITAWSWGWLLILVGIIIDIAIVIVRLAIDKKTKNEVEEDHEWNAD